MTDKPKIFKGGLMGFLKAAAENPEEYGFDCDEEPDPFFAELLKIREGHVVYLDLRTGEQHLVFADSIPEWMGKHNKGEYTVLYNTITDKIDEEFDW